MNIGKYTTLSSSINNLNKNLTSISTQISSEKSFNQGSEDISKFSLQLQTEKKLTNLDNIKNDLNHANKMLDASEVNINSLEGVIDNVYKELMKVSSTGQYRQEDRVIVKDLLVSMKKEITDIGNAKIDGQYVFSGQFTDRKPLDIEKYTIDPISGRKIFDYNGSPDKKTVHVDENIKSEYGITGKQLFTDTNILSTLDNIINIMEDPATAINNQLKKESLDINNEVIDGFYTNEKLNYENISGITQDEINQLDDFYNQVIDFNKDNTTNNLTDLNTLKNNLLTLPTFNSNPDGLNKMMDISSYIQDLKKYNDTGSMTDFNESFKSFHNLNDDINYPTQPFSTEEKEQLKFMFELGNYNKSLNNYAKQGTPELFDNMEINKKYMQNKIDTQSEFDEFSKINEVTFRKQINLYNSQLQTDTSLSSVSKNNYQLYNDAINNYFDDKSAANKAKVDIRKNALDALALPSSYNTITQNIQDMVDYNTGVQTTWNSNLIDNKNIENQTESMFNLTKNPLSNNLSEWEDVRNNVSLLHANVGNQTNYFSQVNSRVEEQHLSLEVFYQKNISVDMADAAMQLQSKSNSLNALYSVIAKLQDLSLTKYI